MSLTEIRRAHFIAIGGVGMSGIAWVWLHRGIAVSGSDLVSNRMTRRLAEHGAQCFIGHRGDHLDSADVVIVSTAIGEDNCELVEARRRGLPVWHRSQALSAVMEAGRSIAVSGTHGKTTTTSMLGLIFERAGCDPTVIIGGESADFGGTAKCGRSDWVVTELDESDGSFLRVRTDNLIVTNIESDHLDHYADYDGIVHAFQDYIERVDKTVVMCTDCPGVRRVLATARRPVVRYSVRDGECDYAAGNIELNGHGARFDLRRRGACVGHVNLSAPGLHNVSNAVGALALAIEAGLDPQACCGALAGYGGVGRRLTVRGESGGVLIVDDYAHHPSEIAATLTVGRAWARERGGRLYCCFQPHRYTRTALMGRDFGPAFAAADALIVTGVYAAGEQPIEGVTGALVADSARAAGVSCVRYCAQREDVPGLLTGELRPGDIFMTLGAGDVWKTGEEVQRLIAQAVQAPAAEAQA